MESGFVVMVVVRVMFGLGWVVRMWMV